MIRFNCIATPEEIQEVEAIIALDLDGVIADNYITSVVSHIHGLTDPRLLQFIGKHPKYFERNGEDMKILSSYDVSVVNVSALIAIVDAAREIKAGFVIVSSWINTPESCKAIEVLLHYLGGKTDHKLVLGQTSGVGHAEREKEFFQWVREYAGNKLKTLIAIDDSAERHFPYLHQSKAMISPTGRNLFTMDDYIRLIRMAGAKDSQWFSWAEHGYLGEVEVLSLKKKSAIWEHIMDS